MKMSTVEQFYNKASSIILQERLNRKYVIYMIYKEND